MRTAGTAREVGLEEALGADLAALVRARGAAVARVSEVTTLRTAARRRGAFAIDLASGERWKGRRFESAERAREASRLRPLAGEERFAPLLASGGDALLLEWVPGAPLDALPEGPPAALLRRCGDLLGGVHARGAGAAPAGRSHALALLPARLERHLAALLERGAIGEALAGRARAAARADLPSSASEGVILTDLAAENVVLRADGALVIVDEANLSVGPHDLDLARTLARWPMGAGGLAAFLEGYEAHRPVATFLAHLRSWGTLALLASAASRARSGAPGVAGAIARLAALLDAGPGADALGRLA